MTFRCSPGWRAVTLAGVILNLVGDVGDQIESLRQVGPPDGMGMHCCRYAGQPWQRTRVSWSERCEAPVEDGRHVVGGSEVASGGGCQQVAEWMFTGSGREGQQMSPQGRPGRFGS